MRAFWALLRVLLVAAACIASGTLECGGRIMTEPEARGATVYHRMCSVCHGADGSGYAADNAPAIANPAYLGVVSDPFLQTVIGNGRAGTTMSAWSSSRSGPLGYRDISAVVAYLRTFAGPPRLPLDEGVNKGDSKRGMAEFKSRCQSCHGEKGVGGPYVHIGDADFLASAGNGMLRATIREGRTGTLMPSFEREL